MPSDGDGGGDPTTVVVSASRVPTVLRGTPSTPTMPTTPTTTVTTTTTTTTTEMPPYNAKDTITARGSYCGSSFVTALRTCEPIRSCHDDGDCIRDDDGKDDGKGLEKEEEERCFDNISCTFHASKAVIAGVGTKDDVVDAEEEGDGVKFAAANDFQGNGSTTRSTHVGVGTDVARVQIRLPNGNDWSESSAGADPSRLFTHLLRSRTSTLRSS